VHSSKKRKKKPRCLTRLAKKGKKCDIKTEEREKSRLSPDRQKKAWGHDPFFSSSFSSSSPHTPMGAIKKKDVHLRTDQTFAHTQPKWFIWQSINKFCFCRSIYYIGVLFLYCCCRKEGVNLWLHCSPHARRCTHLHCERIFVVKKIQK